jgi:hypothetical protein
MPLGSRGYTKLIPVGSVALSPKLAPLGGVVCSELTPTGSIILSSKLIPRGSRIIGASLGY